MLTEFDMQIGEAAKDLRDPVEFLQGHGRFATRMDPSGFDERAELILKPVRGRREIVARCTAPSQDTCDRLRRIWIRRRQLDRCDLCHSLPTIASMAVLRSAGWNGFAM